MAKSTLYDNNKKRTQISVTLVGF